MVDIIRLKRRPTGGAAGAPAALKTTEAAYNEVDNVLYLGIGNDGSNNATSVLPIAGSGAVSSHIHNAAPKATPVDADEVGLIDSAATFALKRLTWLNLKATLKTYFDTLYALAAHVHTFASLTAKPTTLAGYGITDAQMISEKGAANGYAGLDGTGKVPSAQLPAVVAGGLQYQGTWDATANTPVIPAAAAGNKGWYWKVATAGTTTIDTINDWKINDWIISNGAVWDKIDNTDQVTSVAGRQGAVTLTNADIAGLGTMATQSAAAVVITGGTIDGVTFDGGTF
jgi:hypothetical protein